MTINPCVFDVNCGHIDRFFDEEEANKTIVECFKKVMDHVPDSAKKEIEILKQKNEIIVEFVLLFKTAASFCIAKDSDINTSYIPQWCDDVIRRVENVQGT